MNIAMNLEVHFYDQELASVFFESTASGQDQQFGETLIFALFSLRLMVNLGAGQVSDSLAFVLKSAPGKGIDAVASEYDIGGVSIVPYPGHPGRKSFVAKAQLVSNKLSFDLKANGFGLLAQGVGYYAPTAVMVVLRYLARKRAVDAAYLANLARTAEMCGAAHLDRELGLTNQHQLALTIAKAAGRPRPKSRKV